MNLIEFNGRKYPAFQAEGFAAQYIFPFAGKFCHGRGLDIGCGKKEWSLPGSVPIDVTINTDEYTAFNLPDEKFDYIFSSHCLEHLDDWVSVLDYWTDCLKLGGILFLYLPDYSQEYWRPWNNRKHKNIFTVDIICDYMKSRGYKNILQSGVDLNNSFAVVGENEKNIH
jgi:predicted SAM-dependent methyltransferase